MNKPYVKKILAVIVFLLFMSMSVIPSTGNKIEKKSSIPISNGYIQDLIDNASDGVLHFYSRSNRILFIELIRTIIFYK